jgi:hypothetical protein
MASARTDTSSRADANKTHITKPMRLARVRRIAVAVFGVPGTRLRYAAELRNMRHLFQSAGSEPCIFARLACAAAE